MLDTIGAVFSMTNAADHNQVIAFTRDTDGTLTRLNAYNTGGSGTGAQMTDPLASQGSLLLSQDGCFLFAVNAGSNSISSFAASPNGELRLLEVVSSRGDTPNCLAVHGNILYVANSGNAHCHAASSLVGFRMDSCGRLCHIPGAVYALSSQTAKPACIVFHPRGNSLVVSELSKNLLTVFRVGFDGRLTGGVVNASHGAGPFGSVFTKRGALLVTEAGANAFSSYDSSEKGVLTVISGSIANGQAATCWVALHPNQRFAYGSNAGSDTISIYDVSHQGVLTFRKNVLNTPNGTAAPLDSGISGDGKYLYVLNGNEGTISVFHIVQHGELALLEVYNNTGLPQLGAQGLAVLH